jgi:hypothetical protein
LSRGIVLGAAGTTGDILGNDGSTAGLMRTVTRRLRLFVFREIAG